MSKVQTTTIGGGAQYARVSVRLQAFRSDNPRASIETTTIPQESGMMMFRTKIVKDKADEFSAESTGHALQTKEGQKDFEKLETVSVGRALALLGYGADGEIASSEEMEEFEEYKNQKLQEEVDHFTDLLQATKSLEELKEVWSQISNGNVQQALTAVINDSSKAGAW